MPLTPFIGLSVLVHMCVIAGHKLFSWVPRKESNKKPASSLMHLASFAIIVLVFAAVLANATLLVWASVHSKYSSFNLVKDFVIKDEALVRASQ